MRRLRALWRLARVLLHSLRGVLMVSLWRTGLVPQRRHAQVRWWAARTLHLLGVRLDAQGHWRPGAKLVLANHVSWLDIMAVHAVCPEARFVSKAEVRHWPLIGRLVDAAGTLYIERESRRDAMRVVHHMAQALLAGDTVAVFPEGTTGPGDRLLPFHANLLQAAIATGTPVQPVGVRYSDAASPASQAARFVGDTTLMQSLWRLACAERLTVHLTVLDAQDAAHADRRALAQHLRECIAQALEPALGCDPR